VCWRPALDLHAWQSKVREQVKADPKKSAQSNFQFQWILGLDDRRPRSSARKSSLSPASPTKSPAGADHARANDRVVPVEAAHKLYAALQNAEEDAQDFHSRGGRSRALPGG